MSVLRILLNNQPQQRLLLLQRTLQRNFTQSSAVQQQQKQRAKKSSTSARTTKSDEDEFDTPINYIGSGAAAWRARDTTSGGADRILWYQPYVISASLTIFLLYFCVFREENDIDRKLEGNLFEKVDGLEEIALSVNYKYNKEHGLDNTEVERRLRELDIDIQKLIDTGIASKITR